MISVIDYGAGNLRSVQNAIDAIGAKHCLVTDPVGLRTAKKIILPGVGHFGQMMRALDRLELRGPLLERVRAGVPFFGICLGLQALFESSEEAPGSHGLAIFPGTIRRFAADQRVPHMGWNQLHRRAKSKLLAGLSEHPFVYFANSYYAPGEAASATCTYGVEFAAVIERENISAVQFHPEKSGPAGLQILKNFVCS
ncbi:MAG: imidazole glycerol phosphate synthase subunit HisH [Acidobacteriia bacterium]|nr:imidazole glycerol phosphate synthase subunit HisH [Terriglobia bacterium]